MVMLGCSPSKVPEGCRAGGTSHWSPPPHISCPAQACSNQPPQPTPSPAPLLSPWFQQRKDTRTCHPGPGSMRRHRCQV